MPTVDEFLRGAALLEEAGAHARVLLSPVLASMGREVLTGGALTDSTDVAIVARQRDAHRLAGELFRLANECRFRAAVVTTAAAEAAAFAQAFSQFSDRRAGFERRLEQHRTNPHLPHPGRAPRPPVAPPRPPRWADF